MLYNLDLHTHLRKTRESPKRYWNQVIENNLLGTAITEYNDCNPKKAYFDLLARKPKDKVLIPGMKIMSDCGEVLVYSSDDDIYNYSILYEDNVSLKRLIDFCSKKNYLITIAHPFGSIKNSATYIMGLPKLEKLISEKNIGVEAYTGILGYLSYYMYDSFFLRTLRRLFNYFELHKFFNIIGVNKISDKVTKKIDQKSYDVVFKFSAAIKLAQKAKYVTAGSGSYYVDRIGNGVLTIDIPSQKSFFEEMDTKKQIEYVLDKIKSKKIIAVGPPGKYTEDLFIRSTARKTKIKAYNDLMYLTKNSIKQNKK
jgi:hypothetical protein